MVIFENRNSIHDFVDMLLQISKNLQESQCKLLVEKIIRENGRLAFTVDDIIFLDEFLHVGFCHYPVDRLLWIFVQLDSHFINPSTENSIDGEFLRRFKLLLRYFKNDETKKLYGCFKEDFKKIHFGTLIHWCKDHHCLDHLNLQEETKLWKSGREVQIPSVCWKNVLKEKLAFNIRSDLEQQVKEFNNDFEEEEETKGDIEDSSNSDEDWEPCWEDDVPDIPIEDHIRGSQLDPDKRLLEILRVMAHGRNSSEHFDDGILDAIIELCGGEAPDDNRRLNKSNVINHKRAGGFISVLHLAWSLKTSIGAVLQTDCGTVKNRIAVGLCFQVMNEKGELTQFRDFVRNIEGKDAEKMVKSIDHVFGELGLALLFAEEDESIIKSRLTMFHKNKEEFQKQLAEAAEQLKKLMLIYLGDKMEQASIRACFGDSILLIHCGAHKLDLFVRDVFSIFFGLDGSLKPGKDGFEPPRSYKLLKLASKTFSSSFAYISERSLSWAYHYWYYLRCNKAPHIPMISISRWGSCLRSILLMLEHLPLMIEFLDEYCPDGLAERYKSITEMYNHPHTIPELLFLEAFDRRFHSRFIKSIAIVNKVAGITLFRLWKAFGLYWNSISRINPSFQDWLGLNPDGTVVDSTGFLDFQFNDIKVSSDTVDPIVLKYYGKIDEDSFINEKIAEIWEMLKEKSIARTRDVFESSLGDYISDTDFEDLLYADKDNDQFHWELFEPKKGKHKKVRTVNGSDGGEEESFFIDAKDMQKTLAEDHPNPELVKPVIKMLLKKMVITNHSCEHGFTELGKRITLAPHSSKIFIMNQAAFMNNKTASFAMSLPRSIIKNILSITGCYNEYVGKYAEEQLAEAKYKFSLVKKKRKKKIDDSNKADPSCILLENSLNERLARNNIRKKLKENNGM
eukprot:TRINITY_DN1486_c0_g1_i4.p1 TRINITY_DN1486_c0_g1~~TRINITY_DN1486_c0_g1_i4.p1  ORF type:complete len:906 (-),score=234.35 TRINITY_DN1486_c0_g1_i4:2135-4852(-)